MKFVKLPLSIMLYKRIASRAKLERRTLAEEIHRLVDFALENIPVVELTAEERQAKQQRQAQRSRRGVTLPHSAVLGGEK